MPCGGKHSHGHFSVNKDYHCFNHILTGNMRRLCNLLRGKRLGMRDRSIFNVVLIQEIFKF